MTGGRIRIRKSELNYRYCLIFFLNSIWMGTCECATTENVVAIKFEWIYCAERNVRNSIHMELNELNENWRSKVLVLVQLWGTRVAIQFS